MNYCKESRSSRSIAVLLALLLMITLVCMPSVAFANEYDDYGDEDYSYDENVNEEEYYYDNLCTFRGVHYDFVNDELIIGREGVTEIYDGDAENDNWIPWDGVWNSDLAESIKKVSFRGKVIGKGRICCLFRDLTNVTEIDFTNFDTSQSTDFNQLFCGCNSLKSLDLSGFDTRNVTDMGNMFYGCESLKSLDLSNFNTKKVENMAYMFMFCNNLTDLNISSFNTSNVTDLEGMFDFCASLKKIDLKHFDTSKAKNMEKMFSNCTSLNSLNVSSFNTSKVTDMSFMFYDCHSLKDLNISNFDMKNVKKADGMMLFSDPSTLKTPTNLKLDTYLNKPMYDSSGKKYENLPKSSKSIKLTKKKPTVTEVKGTTINSVSATEKGFTVKLNKQTKKTNGYQIRYSTKSSMKNSKTVSISSNKTITKKISKLKAKTKYFIQVRTFREVNGKKIFSSWSKKKSIKTK